MAPEKKRIVILGGGICSLVTAFELTRAPGWQEHYDITLYQLGWRLGGKAASGRDQGKYGRIEEHGFHFWWGFYENAFTMLRRCYDEVEWPEGYPITTWDAAFKPITYTEDEVYFQGGWRPNLTSWLSPPAAGTPGDGSPPPLPSRAEYIGLLIGQMIERGLHLHFGQAPVATPAALDALMLLPWWRRLWELVEQEAGDAAAGMGMMLVRMAHAIATLPDDGDFDLGDRLRFDAVSLILKAAIDGLWLLVRDDIGTNRENYLAFVQADFIITIVRGMIADVIEQGFQAINGGDFRAWMGAHGANDLTLKCYLVTGIYDMAFCYEDGDMGKPNVEAGSALQIIVRMLCTYRGAYMYYMDASMADVVITPLYLRLRQRGVNIQFFHRVKGLHIGDAGGPAIAAVSLGRQVDLVDPSRPYEPLVPAAGLLGWPSEPLYDQIVQGERLRERITLTQGEIEIEVPRYNLESFWTEWQDVGEQTLRYGHDYDLLVLGISLGSLPFIARELMEADGPSGERWRAMARNVKTNQTQALQLWLKETYRNTGWPYKQRWPLDGELDTNHAYVDTWADMSHVLRWEGWPAADAAAAATMRPEDVSYFIGVLKDDEALPPPDDYAFPRRQLMRVASNSLGFLREEVHLLWPDATRPDGPYPQALDWGLLIDDEGRSGVARLSYQFWRANIDPSERYVLSLAGSTVYRMKTDESGYHNLYLTGDWIFNGANVGFVDGAVTSAMRTSQAITLSLMGQQFPPAIYGWDEY